MLQEQRSDIISVRRIFELNLQEAKAETCCAKFAATIASAIYGAIQLKPGLTLHALDSSSSVQNHEAENQPHHETPSRTSQEVLEEWKVRWSEAEFRETQAVLLKLRCCSPEATRA